MIRVEGDPELFERARGGTRTNLDALAYRSPYDGRERGAEAILQPLDALLRMSGRALGSARLVAHVPGPSHSPRRRVSFVRGATR